ncbi:MAG TPA: IS1595 family transposase [Rhizomicrobium sp.]|nr:IS1595 family transposase [Rhizomicrobium sp.]
MNLTAKIYTDETAARQHLEKLLWPNGPLCPHCGSLDAGTKLKGKSTRPGVYWCNSCQKPYSVTVGTVMEKSHIPLNKWLLATHLLTSSKKGFSAHQLMRVLGLGSYRSAWFLAHRIREAMGETNPPLLGGPGKIVEADETYTGKKEGEVASTGFHHKRTVVGLVERGGKSRMIHVNKTNKREIQRVLDKHADKQSHLMTDEARHYVLNTGFAKHCAVDHGKGEYGRYEDGLLVSTNAIEGAFSIFKRGMYGTYQHCGEQHLQRYLNEFGFRYSNRAKLGIDDAMRAETALKGAAGKRLTYRRLNGQWIA